MTEPDKRSPGIDALARRLPRRAPDPERSHALRAALLEAARSQPDRWPRGAVLRGWAIGLGGLAAAAACALIALRGPAHEVADPRSAPLATTADGPTSSPRPEAGKSAVEPGAPRPEPGKSAVEPGAPRPEAGKSAVEPGALRPEAGKSAVEPGAPRPEPGTPRPEPGIQIPDGLTTFDTRQPVQLTRGGVTLTAPPGARFDVDVHDDAINRVTVKAGWVVIASSRAAATIVVERQVWTAPVEPPTAPPAAARASAARVSADRAPVAPRPETPPRAAGSPAPPGTPRVAVSPPPEAAEPPPASASGPGDIAAQPAPATAPPATGEQDFHDGLHALLAGDPRAAVGPLDRACAISSRTQEDMCYWAAVAWLRAGDRAHARASFADVVSRFPHATHAGEASVALGWLLLEHGDPVAARAQFAAAAADPLPSVRADAQRGLAATH